MKLSKQLLVVMSLTAIMSFALAERSGRPENLRLAEFQFGPANRWTFSHIREVLPTVNIPHDGTRVLALKKSTLYTEEFSVSFQGQRQNVPEFAERQYIDGLLILKDGEIVVEQYFGHLTPDRPHLMMSVTKSVVGILAGILAADGVIDLSKPVSGYVPELTKGGWGPDSLQTLLDMRDGADYTEDYEDFSSTVRMQDCAVGWTDADYCAEDGPRGGYDFFSTVGRNEANLGKFVYKSGSTDVIGWVLEEATGQPLAELISQYIWQPMGAEFDANITVDERGFVLADGGMNSTLRDLARFGLLIINDGVAFGKQVIPTDFIADIHEHPADPNWPYDSSADDQHPYYRSFWWGRGNTGRDIRGLGVHGQYLHVAPADGIVIVIYSTWPRASGDRQTHGWDLVYELGTAIINELRN